FSQLSAIFGYVGSSGMDDGRREVVMPAILFVQDAVRRGDYVSVIAYDMRATPLTDFTNDPGRINQVITLLTRNWPAFREANMFMKKFGDRLGPTDSLDGFPGRMTLYQAQNTLTTLAKESGGAYFPVTFEGELPSALSSINNLMRNQYSLAYKPTSPHDGKQHKIVVKVDADGDGTFEEGIYDIQHRRFYNAPKG